MLVQEAANVMLFYYNYFKKIVLWAKIFFLNLATECSLILDYSIH